MAKPWEQYQQKDVTPKGPWEQYAQARGPAKQVPADLSAAGSTEVQEMPEELGQWGRFVAQNLTNSPEATVGYLQKKLPNYDVQMKEDGKVTFWNPVMNKTFMLDPDTGAVSSDIVGDVLDVSYPIAAGVAEGAAATLGGTAGATLGGAGALPGAMLAGAATGAALESGRQGLGKLAGVPQEFDTGEVKTAAAFGGLAPGGEKLLAKGAEFGAKKVFPKLAEKLSGVRSDVVKYYQKNAPEIDAMEANPDLHGIELERLQEGLQGALAKGYDKYTEMMNTGRATSKETFDIEPFKKSLEERLSKLQGRYARNATEENRQLLEKLQNYYNQKFFTKVEVPKGPTRTTKDVLKAPSEGLKITDVDAPKYRSTATERVLGMDEESGMQRIFTETVNTPKGVKEVKYRYEPANTKMSADEFHDWKEGLETVYDAGKGKFENLTDPSMGIVGQEMARWAKDSSQKASKELTKKIPKLAEANKGFSEMAKTQESIAKHFGDDEVTYKTIKNLGSDTKTILKGRLSKILNKQERDALEESSLKLQAYSTFAKPSSMPLSSLGATSTTRSIGATTLGAGLGTYLGYKTDTGAFGGGMLGATLGSMFGGPSAMRAYTRGMRNVGKGYNLLQPEKTLPAAAVSSWELMNQDERTSK